MKLSESPGTVKLEKMFPVTLKLTNNRYIVHVHVRTVYKRCMYSFNIAAYTKMYMFILYVVCVCVVNNDCCCCCCCLVIGL